MNFDFIINKFFETKLVKGYPECPDCPPPDPDCPNPCGCDDGGPCPCCAGAGGGGPGGGGGGGPGPAPGGKVEDLEAEVATFLAVGQTPAELCKKEPPACPDCTWSAGATDGAGWGGSFQCEGTTDWEFLKDAYDFIEGMADAWGQAIGDALE